MPRILRITPEMAGVPAAAPLARQGETPSPWPAVAQAAGSLARTVQSTGKELLRIQGALQEEDAKLDAQENFNRLKYDITRREAEIRGSIAMPEAGPVGASDRNGGVGAPSLGDGAELLAGPAEEPTAPTAALVPAGTAPTQRPPQPKDYYQTFEQDLDKMVNESAKRLKYPGMERAYRAQIAPFIGAQKVDALNRGIKLQHESIMLRDDLDAREEAHVAVYGNDAQRAAARDARFSRLDRQVASGLRSAESAVAAKDKFLAAIEDGGIERDFRSSDATLKNSVVANLRAGNYKHLEAGAQQRKADELEHRERVVQEAQNKELKAAREAAGQEAEKMLVDFMAAGNKEAARGVLAAGRSVLSPDAYRQWQERIDKPSTKATPDEVKNALIPQVYNASNNPAEVDRALRDAYARGLVADDDMKAWAGHLETRLNRLTNKAVADQARRTADQARDETRLVREHAQVEQRLREMTRVTGPAAAALDTAAQDTLNWGLEDLDRNSPLWGKGNERPMDWLKRQEPTIRARIGTVARQRLGSIDQGLDFKNAQSTGATLPAVRHGLDLLEANKSRMPRDRYLDQLRLLKEKEALINEVEKWQATPPTTGGTAAPAAKPGGGTNLPPQLRLSK